MDGTLSVVPKRQTGPLTTVLESLRLEDGRPDVQRRRAASVPNPPFPASSVTSPSRAEDGRSIACLHTVLTFRF